MGCTTFVVWWKDDDTMDVMPEELDLYMCLQIWLSDIFAFLVAGDFNWDKNYDVDAAT